MIYLDNAATSFPKAPGVAEAVAETFLQPMGNANRSSHHASIRSTIMLVETREMLAEFLRVKHEERIIFTSNATTAINMAIFGLVKPGMKVMTSPVEHNAVMRPLRYLEQQGLIEIIKFELNNEYDFDKKSVETTLAHKPNLLVTTSASNVFGNVISINEISKQAKEAGCTVIIDGAQTIGNLPVDLSDGNIDIFCFPGHKGLMGPAGTGGMYVSDKIDPKPILFGGTGSVSDEEYLPEFYPDKLESGTHNLHGISGLNAALQYILKETVESMHLEKHQKMEYLLQKLFKIDELQVLTASPERNAGVISLATKVGTITDLTEYLDKNDIAVRMGLHCAPATHKFLNTFDNGGTIRISPGHFTTQDELDRTIKIIEQYFMRLNKKG
ncbi:MAG: aminotransferase class V-fold PLP-dependent enzyme [Candidatus Cloacimonetes bacterium]|nr:aminotransferase class V-fold PLP-dependent enzyme [Candidatus Cloacimonadota bacterium]